MKTRQRIFWAGESLDLRDIAEREGVSYRALYYRVVSKGMDVSCAIQELQVEAVKKYNTDYYIYKGKKLKLKQIARVVGIAYNTLWTRINIQKLTLAEAINVENRNKLRMFEWQGSVRNLKEICEMEKLSYASLYYRVITKKQDLGLAVNSLRSKKRQLKNVTYVFQGKHLTLKEISQETGIPYSSLWASIHRKGLTLGEAILGKSFERKT